MAHKVDLFVIGAGSGGLAAAKRAASYGAKVAIAEKDMVGGTCVIRGCVPKKMMANGAAIAQTLEDSAGYGFFLQDKVFDFGALVAHRNSEVARLNKLHISLLEEAGVELVPHHARIVGPQKVEADGEVYDAQHILVATGGHPIKPEIPGAEHGITSDELWALTELPKEMLIVGSGYIGCEFACIFQALGTKVTMTLRHDAPLNGFDPDLRNHLKQEMVAQGIELVENFNPQSANTTASNQVELHGRDGRALKTQHLVFATGRRPNTADLGLESIDIDPTETGALKSDLNGTTHYPWLHAIGDVVDQINLTPMAIRQGRALADRMFGGKDTPPFDGPVATAIFTLPPIGTVGLGEHEAIDKYGADAVQTWHTRFTPMFHTLSGRPEKTFMKVIAEKESGKLLGMHVLGRDGAEMIQGFAVAVGAGLTKADLDRTLAIHPTSAEEFVTLR